MVRIEHSVDIDRALHEVWDFLVDPENVPRWQSSAISSHQISEGPMAVGAKLEDERSFLGRRGRSEVEVTEYEPERLFTLRGTSGPIRFTFRHLLEDHDGATRVHIEAEADSSGLGRLIQPMVERAARHELKGDFARLKTILESGT
jgi:carbon monoxide dehydrogenase subunit G